MVVLPRAFFLIATLALCGPAAAQLATSDTRAAAIEAALKAWAQEHKVEGAALTVTDNGRLVTETAIGTGKLDRPELLASLSKAVTAVCIATLIQDGKLAWSTPLRVGLKKHFARHGPPADARVLSVTVEQLVIHRAGFSTRSDDAVTSATLRGFLKTHTTRQTHIGPLLAEALRQPLAFAPGERHAYSNAGYLALGAIIEETTGKSYEEACRERVLVPLGAKGARLDPTWTILSSFGGWSMTTADYQRFYAVFSPGHPLLKPSTRAWMAMRDGKTIRRNPSIWYSLGVRHDAGADGGATLWHSGSWPWRQKEAKDGELTSLAGAIARRTSSGIVIVATFRPIPFKLAQREPMYADLWRRILLAADAAKPQ
jgi:CubicO group peptidase (beta-lactamase class C family)